MKKYIPEEMVKISRYQNFFPTLDNEIQRDIYRRMTELINEKQEYCDKRNYDHLSATSVSTPRYSVSVE